MATPSFPLFPFFFLYPIDRPKTSFSFLQDPISPLSPSPLVYFDPPPPFPLLPRHRLVLHDGHKKGSRPEVLEWGGNGFFSWRTCCSPLVGQMSHWHNFRKVQIYLFSGKTLVICANINFDAIASLPNESRNDGPRLTMAEERRHFSRESSLPPTFPGHQDTSG